MQFIIILFPQNLMIFQLVIKATTNIHVSKIVALLTYTILDNAIVSALIQKLHDST